MDPALELELLITVAFYMIAVPVVVVGSFAFCFLCIVGSIKERGERRFDEMIHKLVFIAYGDVGLVTSAANNTAVRGKSDLKDVVDYIVKHRKLEAAP